MPKATFLSDSVSSVIFVPSISAYTFLVVGYVRFGLVLYLFMMAGAYRMGLFERLGRWPMVAKVVLACSPMLVALGCYFASIKTTYSMIIPGVAYAIASIIGSFSLRRIADKPPAPWGS